jgi:NADH-quinone oxidoreductase subunit F
MPTLTIDSLRERVAEARETIAKRSAAFKGTITVHMGTCGIAAGAREIVAAFSSELAKHGAPQVAMRSSGCAGLCSREPMATVTGCGAPTVTYGDLTPARAKRIVEHHVRGGKVVAENAIASGSGLSDVPFFAKQVPVVLRNRGVIDPEDFDDCLARDGYGALAHVLGRLGPEQVIEEIRRSGLRGRGGAGFPTGTKWEICRAESKTPKYIIGNCDEGDPGAYMDRSLFESDPHAVLEGMVIAAYAVGASRGYFYIRTEYPLAIARARMAIAQAEEHGFLGPNILGTGFDFNAEIREGSGAFVCGEETSLIHSIEGTSPEPRQRPPYPAQAGLWNCPTVINNVETLATVPAIILRGADWFSKTGTDTSRGTKVFSLVGAIRNTGLIEVPMGITLREIVYDIGGGIQGDRALKAVQTGGPSGGCIPAELIDLTVDYESLTDAGSMMGSGGMIVISEDTCMVDVAKFFVAFTNDESCGKCVTCRDGSDALLEVLKRITEGDGREGDIEFLEELCAAIKEASMCGLGTTLPNPVLSTLRYFRAEYEAHVREKRCPALSCRSLIRYRISAEKCNGCRVCLKNCPLGAIQGEFKQVHVIDQAKCNQCGACLDVCPPKVSAVFKVTGDEARALAGAGKTAAVQPSSHAH